MDRIDALFDHAGIEYDNMTEEEKINKLMEIVYINLINAKKDTFDKMTSNSRSMFDDFMRQMGMPVPKGENEEGFDKVRNKYLNHLIKYRDREDEFFVDECERFNYEATKLIKRLIKIYSLIPDDKEQTNESIIDWDLHQKIMEKKHGKRNISTEYKKW
jgi:carbamoylphosphate synthase large subunit